MKRREDALFWTFLVIFIATAIVTLLGLANVLDVKGEYLAALVPALLVELAASVIVLYRQTFTTVVPPKPEVKNSPSPAVARILGGWWELVTSHPMIALSFVQIGYSEEEGSLQLTGTAYAANGSKAASWDTDAACFNQGDLEVFYFWRGDEVSRDSGSAYSGYGYLKFVKSPGEITEGRGWYTSGESLESASHTRHIHDLRRAKSTELATMTADDMTAREEMARTVNESWRSHLNTQVRAVGG